MNYQEALDYLEGLNVFGIRLGLSRITRLLELLDLPQERYRTIHVTGTNGKGSVSAMLESIIRRSGLHVGLYTSPHLSSYTERMQVNGQPISQQEFADCLSTIRAYVEQMMAEGEECPTQFEVLTALAFFYFAMKQVDYAVIEVGLGGLLDSTNVIVPEISVITNVALEHADRCGGTLEGVAEHKAGIIKNGVPVVTAATGIPLEIIRQKAEEMNTDIFVAGEDFAAAATGFDLERHTQGLSFNSALLGISEENFEVRLLGTHQVQNASLAIMAAELLRNVEPKVDSDVIREGLNMVSWGARFEQMNCGGREIVIDGAHNPAGIKVLRESLDLYYPAKERVFLLGILHDKDIGHMLESLLRPSDVVVVTPPKSDRAEAAAELVRRVSGRVSHVEAYEDNEEALDRALELAGKNRLLVLCGSLYLVGGLRQSLLARRGRERGEANG
ncbi:bifunctional folylpolyglutamate synthase/dihydrofolate synthase [Selenomonas sp. KH1T6]|uniref:bifunctional folylpolyglutamate synthase/dihydrofolate synthase n=1 Tax=Selenomonas sp. KH1T6 TaxID=3158784 RepID=UPI0008A76A72|nr:dihydrofolate synthase / folylpolyglutamate synthase [Selenomonas ruminantium]